MLLSVTSTAPGASQGAALPERGGLRLSRRGIYAAVPGPVAARLSRVAGVTGTDGGVRFDRGVHTEETARLALALASGTALPVNTGAALARAPQPPTPTDADMAMINAHAHTALTADDVAVFEDYAIGTGPVSYPIRFTRSALGSLAEQAGAGRTFLLYHDTRVPVGHTLSATVERATVRGVEADWLRVRWYAPLVDASAERMQAIADCRTGVLRYTSIGFSGGIWDYVTPEGEGDGPGFFLIDDSEDLPLRERLSLDEISRVYLGATYGAGDAVGSDLSASATDLARGTDAAQTAGRDFRPDNDAPPVPAVATPSLIILS